MEINIDTLLQGRATTIKGKNYLPTKAYVEPFLERMSKFTDDFRVQVKTPDQLAIEEDTPIDIYNRVVVQAVLPEELEIKEHFQVIGMVYGLDVRKPVVKFYSGALDAVCTNLSVFSPDQLVCNELSPKSPINFKSLNGIVENIEDTVKTITTLKNTQFDCSYENTSEKLGDWIKRCMSSFIDNGYGKIKVSTSTPIDAYKLLFEDKDSRYLSKEPITNMYNIFSAFTQVITNGIKRDLMNTCEKTLLIKQILGF